MPQLGAQPTWRSRQEAVQFAFPRSRVAPVRELLPQLCNYRIGHLTGYVSCQPSIRPVPSKQFEIIEAPPTSLSEMTSSTEFSVFTRADERPQSTG